MTVGSETRRTLGILGFAALMKAEIRNMAMSTLDQLYSLQPSVRGAIQKAAGYAVLSEISTKILLAGGGLFNGAAARHQISDAGISLDLAVEGTKYFKDPDLN